MDECAEEENEPVIQKWRETFYNVSMTIKAMMND